jgi:hypothetical protein
MDTLLSELRRVSKEVEELRNKIPPMEFKVRTESASKLLLNASRKAMVTRAIERVKRIGIILANGIVEPHPIDEDEIEEMMRIATELTDQDVGYLRDLVVIEGDLVKVNGRIERHTAHTQWERGPWGAQIDSQIDSVFGKLQSYGLVSRIPPPNNLNIGADFQNRYVLLGKGLRFAELAKQKGSNGS